MNKHSLSFIGTLLLLTGTMSFAVDGPTIAIRVDQAGYQPDRPKVAMVVSAIQATDFKVCRTSDGKVVFRATLASPAQDPDSGDQVQLADFTPLTRPGKYYLEVSGVGRSWEFSIDRGVFSRSFYLAMRSFYGQRCGVAVDLGAKFPGYKHDACHLEGAWHPSTGKSGIAPSIKGWHDAGDYGRYIVNSGLSTGTLLWAYEMFPERLKRIRLDIPESGNRTPDILNEIRWNLDWMLSLQDADGGVFHKQTSEGFCDFVLPEKDPLMSYIIGSGKDPYKTTCATADFAAVLAIAGRLYKPFDAGFADRALDAARRAFTWAEAHPTLLFNNPKGVSTGGYGDRDCGDELLWASAELFRTTGGAAYEKYFLDHWEKYKSTLRATGPQSWPNVAPMALWAYVLGRGQGDAAAAIRTAALTAAEEIVHRTATHPYRISMVRSDFIWGYNGVAANYGVQLLVANVLRPNPRFVETAIDNLHYLLGRNTFSLSWLSGIGVNAYQHPHHRPSGADANAAPWPGLLSGGPNGRKQDEAMRKLPDLPPARLFIDDQSSYASNEVAINWNAPLVFLLAGTLSGK